MTDASEFAILTAGDSTLVLDCTPGARPGFVYWGARLDSPDPALLKRMTVRQHAHGGPDAVIEGSLLNEIGSGVDGAPGFLAHRAGLDWAPVFAVRSVERPSAREVKITCEDPVANIRAIHDLSWDASAGGLFTCETEIVNAGHGDLSIDWCAAAVLPLDPRATRLFGFTGRWADEFQMEEIAPFTGAYVRENRKGRTSHDCFPGLIAASQGATEQDGSCFGFHLGWSGNHRTRVDRLSDGRAFLQMGEYFFPGEATLAPGETYRTPRLHAAYASGGFSALSRKFHRHLRQSVMDGRIRRKPRPVHYNTWEAVYFDHDVKTLLTLADKAAEVGVERFILDDGWFGDRRDDKTGLGDWHVSDAVYPNGLRPLIDHVRSLGMEFGLWFEPEMANPDSDLLRAHPDWILQADGVEPIPFRNQVALDLTREDVVDHLFSRMHAILSDHQIDYIKWDMNRDVHHPGSRGEPAISKQIRALYQLMERLRRAHPDLEIESCSSGGGRADYGVLRHADRIWTSDSNDALDRQRIQRGASHFFPLEIMGAHVGPAKCHITGRRLSMKLRVATAFFGHMGLELNLLAERPEDLKILKAGVALHKQHRALLHAGDVHRLDTPDHVNAIGVVSANRSEALFSWCNLTGRRETLPGRIVFAGLDPARQYRTRIIWPSPPRSITAPSIIEAADLGGEGIVLQGDGLMQAGLQTPHAAPETGFIFHLVGE
ncbi:MAG: alpha-galactosidase [Pseudomonadota bacterium]